MKEMLLSKCGGPHVHVRACFVSKPFMDYIGQNNLTIPYIKANNFLFRSFQDETRFRHKEALLALHKGRLERRFVNT
jgi:hypothetical protein